jgi:hypothetical protein
MQKKVDPDFDEDGVIRSKHNPYQQKVFYNVMQDSSEISDESDELALEDKLFA